MKTLYKFLGVFMLAAMVLTACGPTATTVAPVEPTEAMPTDLMDMSWDQVVAQAKEEGEVIFYAWWGEEFWKTAAQQFEDEYGIKATVVIGDNAVDKILAEKDNPVGTVDVQLLGGQSVKTVIDSGLLYGPILPMLPEADKLDPTLSKVQEGVQTGGYLAPIYRNQTGFLYNPDKVTDPPQTWEEFQAWIVAHPKQFAFCDPNKGGSGQAMVQTVIVNLTGGLDQYMGDTELDPAKIAKWNVVWDWFDAHMDEMTLTASNNESIDTLNQGQTSLIIAWDDDTQMNFDSGSLFKGATIYIPTMGLPGGGDTAGILKNAPHKAASLLFIDFLTSADLQQEMNDILGSYPGRIDLENTRALLKDDQRLANGKPWYPAPYKAESIKEFTENALMGQ